MLFLPPSDENRPYLDPAVSKTNVNIISSALTLGSAIFTSSIYSFLSLPGTVISIEKFYFLPLSNLFISNKNLEARGNFSFRKICKFVSCSFLTSVVRSRKGSCCLLPSLTNKPDYTHRFEYMRVHLSSDFSCTRIVLRARRGQASSV